MAYNLAEEYIVTKRLMQYQLNRNLINEANTAFILSENYNNAVSFGRGYYEGGLMSSLNVYNLDRDWHIYFEYAFSSNLSSSWNHIFAFGTHKLNTSGVDNTSFAIAVNSVRPGTQNYYMVRSLDSNWHSYDLIYIRSKKRLTIKIDDVVVDVIDNIEFSSTQKGLYFSGGDNKSINCRMQNFYYENISPLIQVTTNTDLKRYVLYNVNTGTTFGTTQKVALVVPLSSFSAIDTVSITPTYVIHEYTDKHHLVYLDFTNNKVVDFGTLEFNWSTPGPSEYYYPIRKFNPLDPWKKALFLDGQYHITGANETIGITTLNDFTMEIEFIVDKDIKFENVYSRAYISSANINVKGDYYSTLLDMYLLPRYEKSSQLSLTFESNDLYKNTGNVLYTYGWLEKGKRYHVIYVRSGNRFYIIINGKTVYDELLENALVYEKGTTKYNTRYYGPNYLKQLDISLAPTMQPLKSQSVFKGLINTYILSDIARYNRDGGLLYLDKKKMYTFTRLSLQSPVDTGSHTKRLFDDTKKGPDDGDDDRPLSEYGDMIPELLVYVPCWNKDFDKDVLYTKRIPRSENYLATKVGGQFYGNYWRSGYGAIGPKPVLESDDDDE